MKVHDEVCGMSIDKESAAAHVEFQSKTYYFCSERCRGMFEEHPERFVTMTDPGEEEHGSEGDSHCC